jgi:hypothetical protein
MEDTGYTLSRVHVLRHTFRPNEVLQGQLENITQEHRTPYIIFGSDERVIPQEDTLSVAYNAQKSAADAMVARHSYGNFQLERGLTALVEMSRRKGVIALRLAMNVQYTPVYTELMSALDTFRVGERAYAPGLHATRLYVQIPFSKLGPLDEARERVNRFKDYIDDDRKRSLLQVIPSSYLNNRETKRMIRRPSEESAPEITLP